MVWVVGLAGCDDEGPSLRNAVRAGDASAVKELAGRNPSLVNRPDENGDMLLQLAVELGHAGVVRALCEAGADVNYSRGRIGNPLQHAAYYGPPEVLVALLDHGADIEWRSPNERSVKAGTPLCMAAGAGDPETLRVLLQRGASTTPKLGAMPVPPLHYALDSIRPRGSRADVVRLLLEAGADPNARDWNGQTPLQAAKVLGDDLSEAREIMDLLRKHGAKE